VICDARMVSDVQAVVPRRTPEARSHIRNGSLEARMGRRSAVFEPVDTACDDVALLAFTSGTTAIRRQPCTFIVTSRHGERRGRHVLETSPDDIYIGSPRSVSPLGSCPAGLPAALSRQRGAGGATLC